MRKVLLILLAVVCATLTSAFVPTPACAAGACPPPEFAGVTCPSGYTGTWSVGADGNCRLSCTPKL